MKNLFKKSNEKRGLPDSIFHAGNPQHPQNNDSSTMIQVSSSAPPVADTSSNMVLEPDIPSGYPYNSSYPHNNPPPPTDYPYPAQPDEGVSTGAVWEFNTGENINEKGQQRTGNIKAGNTVAGSSTGLSFTPNDRYVFTTGKNINKGDGQETGDIEVGNVFSNSH